MDPLVMYFLGYLGVVLLVPYTISRVKEVWEYRRAMRRRLHDLVLH